MPILMKPTLYQERKAVFVPKEVTSSSLSIRLPSSSPMSNVGSVFEGEVKRLVFTRLDMGVCEKRKIKDAESL